MLPDDANLLFKSRLSGVITDSQIKPRTARDQSVLHFSSYQMNRSLKSRIRVGCRIAGALLMAILVWHAGSGDDRSKPPHFTFPSPAPVRTIDWILVSSDLRGRLRDVRTLESLLSDHRPVTGMVLLSGMDDR